MNEEKIRELFKKYIEDNLEIRVKKLDKYNGDNEFEIKLLLEDEEISTDWLEVY